MAGAWDASRRGEPDDVVLDIQAEIAFGTAGRPFNSPMQADAVLGKINDDGISKC